MAALPAGHAALTLLPFLRESEPAGKAGHVRALKQCRQLVHDLGTDAPVCQLLRPGVYAVVD